MQRKCLLSKNITDGSIFFLISLSIFPCIFYISFSALYKVHAERDGKKDEKLYFLFHSLLIFH